MLDQQVHDMNIRLSSPAVDPRSMMAAMEAAEAESMAAERQVSAHHSPRSTGANNLCRSLFANCAYHQPPPPPPRPNPTLLHRSLSRRRVTPRSPLTGVRAEAVGECRQGGGLGEGDGHGGVGRGDERDGSARGAEGGGDVGRGGNVRRVSGTLEVVDTKSGSDSNT